MYIYVCVLHCQHCFLNSIEIIFENNIFVLHLTELNKHPVEGFSAGLIDDDDIYQWEVVVIGPQDTLL